MMSCPYNHSHVFKKEKFLKHLEHCNEQKHSLKKLYKCKLDSFVRFFKEEKEEHCSKCLSCGRKGLVGTGKGIGKNNKSESIQESNALEQISFGEDFEKSFHNSSIKTLDMNSFDEAYSSQSSIDLNENTILY